MICTACGTQNDPDRKFCLECGARLSVICPSCGSPNPPGKFCGECGLALGGGAPEGSSAADAGPRSTERRLVSVLFLDLVSFTTLSESRDAEDMRSLMDAYFETARTVIERHGGVVEKFIGDAVMAVWGAPVTHEDDAERAVRSGLELVDAVAALGASMELPLQARGGVLTGEAATSQDSGNQGMVTGDMVNTASRLQSAAEPGQVFVGEATYRAASRAVAFDPVGDLTLKGKEGSVPAWRALRVVAERQGHNRAGIEPPFVGRAEELRQLKDMLHATGREGKSRVVSVMGVGGIGKSRLAWELLKYVDGLEETIWWHRGRCPSYGDGITFWALGEMIRMRAGIAETDAPGISRSKLAASVAEHVPDEEERRWLEPRLAFLLGLDERPAGGREELFAAWRTFFERISDVGTVAMVFEDLQWADSGLLDFIESMLEWSRNKPIFIVTLARPELADRRPNWGAGQRSLLAMHLEPLPDATMAELVRGMVPGADGAAVSRIVERAEGMPLYAVEMIRMLADRGVLRPGERLVRTRRRPRRDPGSRNAARADRVAAGRARAGGSRACCRRPRSSGGASRWTPSRPWPMPIPHRSSRGSSTSRGRSSSGSRSIRAPRSAASTRSSRASSGRSPTGCSRRPIAAVGTWRRRTTSRRPTTTSWPASWPRTTSRRWAPRRPVPTPTRWPPGRGTGSGRPRSGRRRSAPRIRRSCSPSRRSTITPPGAERAELLRRAARAAGDALRQEQQFGFLREAIEELHDLGDLNAEAVATGDLVQALAGPNRWDEIRVVVQEFQARLGDGGDDRARAELDHALAYVA